MHPKCTSSTAHRDIDHVFWLEHFPHKYTFFKADLAADLLFANTTNDRLSRLNKPSWMKMISIQQPLTKFYLKNLFIKLLTKHNLTKLHYITML